MKPLSEALMDLAIRAKRLEYSADVVRREDRAALQKRRAELEASLDRETTGIVQSASETRGAVTSWWSNTTAAMKKQVAAMRANFCDFHAHLVEADTARAVRNADQEAIAAITLASCCLDAAEWATVRAELTRADAEGLAKALGRA